MTLFQWIALPVLLLLLARTLARLAAGARPRWWLLLSALIWAAAIVAVLDPDLTTRVARLLGIGRGADLLIYIVAILFIASFFFLYQRYRALENALTALVRRLAIESAEKTGPDRNPPES